MSTLLQKRIIKTLVVIALCTPGWMHGAAQSWQNVGAPGLSAAQAELPALAIDSTGAPYIVYVDYANDRKATVMRYNGTAWVTVGNADFSDSAAYFTSIAIDHNGTPYVAYEDLSNNYNIIVMKYNGASWVQLGGVAAQGSQVAFAIDAGGTPYVAYHDFVSYKATVMKYNGSSWVVVGSAGISAGDAEDLSLAIDGSGTPYLAYQDYSVAANGKATVLKYNGSNWATVGSAGFSDSTIAYPSLAIDGNGTPYLAYSDAGHGYNATLMKYNGSNWSTVGAAGFTPGGADYVSLAVDGSNEPCVAYKDGSQSGKASVMKYNGAWTTVGSAGFSAGLELYSNLAISHTGQLFIAYQDWANSKKATVMSYSGNTLVPYQNIQGGMLHINLFPDPATDQVTVAYSCRDAARISLSVIDATGRTVIAKDLSGKQSGTTSVPINDLPAGVYILQVTNGTEIARQQMVKE